MSEGFFTIFGILIGVLITLYIHSLDRRDKYLFSLIKEKFAATQQAYLYSKILKDVIHGEEQIRNVTLSKIQKWFDENYLYLSMNIRNDFKDTLWNTWTYKDNLIAFYELKNSNAEEDEITQARIDLHAHFNSIMHLDVRIAESLNVYNEYENTFSIRNIFKWFKK